MRPTAGTCHVMQQGAAEACCLGLSQQARCTLLESAKKTGVNGPPGSKPLPERPPQTSCLSWAESSWHMCTRQDSTEPGLPSLGSRIRARLRLALDTAPLGSFLG